MHWCIVAALSGIGDKMKFHFIMSQMSNRAAKRRREQRVEKNL